MNETKTQLANEQINEITLLMSEIIKWRIQKSTTAVTRSCGPSMHT